MKNINREGYFFCDAHQKARIAFLWYFENVKSAYTWGKRIGGEQKSPPILIIKEMT